MLTCYNAILDNYGVEQGVKLSTRNIGETGSILGPPLYLTSWL